MDSECDHRKVPFKRESDNVAWYPCKPPTELPVCSESATKKQEPGPHPIWTTGALKYTSTLWWSPNIKKEKKEACRRHRIKGVEIRDLGSDHFLCGEKGLFATERFSKFDIVGEYTGRVVDDDVNGHYVAALEDKTLSDSLGVDAGDCGNELRFINSYLNVAFAPNVTMRTAHVNTYPHIVIVCCEDIEVGEELLLDYGKAYTDAFLTPKAKVVGSEISMDMIKATLPGYGDEDEDEENH